MRYPRVRKWLRRTLIWGLGVLVTLVVVAGATGVWTVRRAFPEHSGEMALKGLSAKVTVHRDEYGIPQLYAKTEDDLLKAQGFVHAQDRFWEMDFRRHVTAGRVSELFGQSQVKTDTYLRTMGWRRVAEQELALIAPATRNALQSYADGVNAWLAANADAKDDGYVPNGAISLEYSILALQNGDYVIEKWTPADSLAWLKAMAWDLRGNMEDEIRRQALLAQGLTKEKVDQLYPVYPFDRNKPIVGTGTVVKGSFSGDKSIPVSGLKALETDLANIPGLMGNVDGEGIGSNSWVVSGSLTGTGKPLLANDPHLSPSQPGIWYQMGLHCECGLEVAGFTFSGVPGVVIGHNARIAWGFTNLGPDVIDMYLEKTDAVIASREETIKVAGGADVKITVRSTKHGPLLSDASEEMRKLSGEYALAIRWTALDPGKTADAIFAINRAANWQEFRAAAAQFEVPSQNIVYADVDGNIGYQAPGKIPVRAKGDGKWFAPGWDPAYDWTGYIPFAELPSVYNPPSGYIVTANQAVIDKKYPHLLTDDWSYGYRSQRINEMIAAQRTVSMDDIQKMQFDNRNGFAPTLIPALQKAPRPPLSQVEQNADALLTNWDFQQKEDSPAAAYYNAIWRNLLYQTFDELGEYIPDGGDRWFEVVRGLLDKPNDPWWDHKKTTDKVETRDDMLAIAMSAAVKELSDAQGETPSSWEWGKMHTLTPTHATFGESGIGPIEWLFNRSAAPVSGGDAIVNATGWTAKDGYEVDAVPSMRMIVNLANMDDSRWIQLTGNSGHAFHPNYGDQFERWRTGQLLSFRFTKANIEAESVETLTLTP